MAETNDTFRVPSDMTDFSDNDQVDLRKGRPEIAPYKATRLTLEAIGYAASSSTQGETDTPETRNASHVDKITHTTSAHTRLRALKIEES